MPDKSQLLVEHGHTVHTNRARDIFISEYDAGNTTGSSAGSRKGIGLDGAADEYVTYHFSMPNDFVSITSIKIVAHGMMGNSGDVIFNVVASGGKAGEGVSTNSTTLTAESLSVSNSNISEVALSSNPISWIEKGDYVNFKLTRDADNGSDTLADDWVILGLLIEYTADM